jgi:hypothetical protein
VKLGDFGIAKELGGNNLEIYYTDLFKRLEEVLIYVMQLLHVVVVFCTGTVHHCSSAVISGINSE